MELKLEWEKQLTSLLASLPYRIKVIESLPLSEAEIGGFDALVATATPEVIHFFSQLFPDEQRPLLILVESPALEPNPYAFQNADTVLLYHDTFLPYQVESLLRLRQKLQHQASSTIASLESEIATQKRINNEIEVLKNAIVRNVSHELRTPLLQVKTGIALMGDALSANTLPSMTVFTLAQDATAALEGAIKHITMLGTSLEYNPCAIIFRDIASHSVRNLNRVWQRKGDVKRIQVVIEPQLPPVSADKQGLSTALQLLLDNALKFSKHSDDKRVIMSARRDGDSVLISVQDFGIGIEPNTLASIFTLFFQADSSNTRTYGGMGVGLSIVKLIMDSHNTEITVVSEHGKGSTFSFRLPAVDLYAGE